MASLKDKVSFILYEDNKIPSYKQLNKRTHSFFLYAPAAIFVLSIIILTASVFYVRNIETIIRSEEPKIISDLRLKYSEVNDKNQEHIKTIENLTEKLSSTAPLEGLESLALFMPVKGQKDLTNPAQINIQDIRFDKGKDQVFLRFNIINSTPDNRKLSGYIHVFMTDGTQFFRFPALSEALEDYRINFIQGESFATSRFRPVEGIFDYKGSQKSLIFKIIIFNRLGDLIHQQQFKQDLR